MSTPFRLLRKLVLIRVGEVVESGDQAEVTFGLVGPAAVLGIWVLCAYG